MLKKVRSASVPRYRPTCPEFFLGPCLILLQTNKANIQTTINLIGTKVHITKTFSLTKEMGQNYGHNIKCLSVFYSPLL